MENAGQIIFIMICISMPRTTDSAQIMIYPMCGTLNKNTRDKGEKAPALPDGRTKLARQERKTCPIGRKRFTEAQNNFWVPLLVGSFESNYRKVLTRKSARRPCLRTPFFEGKSAVENKNSNLMSRDFHHRNRLR